MNLTLFKSKITRTAAFLLLFFIQLSTQAAVWDSQHHWNEPWENAYSKWVQAYWKPEVYLNPDSILYNIPTDCADASYNMRAVFAYTYKLPFKAGALTNQTQKFDRIFDPKEKFRSFIRAANDITSTSTLSDDTYPIAINKKQFRAGIIFVALKPTNHTMQIVAVSETGIPTILDSTEPVRIRKLSERQTFAPHFIRSKQEGYRAFKWPEHFSKSESQNSLASQQQFEMIERTKHLDLFFYEIETLLRERPETLTEKTERLLTLICNETNYRISNVEEALTEMSKKPVNSCFNNGEYSDYSTPNRDQKLVIIYRSALNFYNDPYFKKELSPKHLNILNSIFSNKENQIRWCPLKLKSGLSVTLFDVWSALSINKLISDPNANEKQRWGLEDYRARCKQY